MRARFLTVALLAASPALAAAQGATPLVGKWAIEYERGRRMENGTVTPVLGSATLAIETRGEELVATLTSPARPDGTVPAPVVMTGKATVSGALFQQKGKATLNINGEPREVESVVTWTLAATGDELRGSMMRELPGAGVQVPTEPSPVKGTRAK